MRLTVGGNLCICLYDVSAPTSDMTTAKLLFNSVISTPGARFITLNLKNFYLKTPLPQPRYMKIKIDILLNEIIKNTTCATFSTTSMCISKLRWACMDFLEQASWPKISSRSDSSHMATTNINSSLAFTATCGAPSCSA